MQLTSLNSLNRSHGSIVRNSCKTLEKAKLDLRSYAQALLNRAPMAKLKELSLYLPQLHDQRNLPNVILPTELDMVFSQLESIEHSSRCRSM